MKNFYSITAIVLLAVLVLGGCPPTPPPPPPTPLLRVDQAALQFTATDDQFQIAISSLRGELAWTATTDQPWLLLDRSSGKGDSHVNVSIDRSKLDPAKESTGTVTVRAGDQRIAIPVTAVSAFTPVDTAYFPMAVGNTWSYSLEGLSEQIGMVDIEALELSVADQFTAGGFDVWQVNISARGLETSLPAFKGVNVNDLTGDSPTLETFWVFVDGAWYGSASRDDLDALPATDNLIPLASVLQWPGTLAYLEASGLLESAFNEMIGIFATAEMEFDGSRTALFDYLSRVLSGDTDDVFALLTAFGTEFTGYDSGDPAVDAYVQLLADIGLGAEPLYTFASNAYPLFWGLVNQLLESPGYTTEYWVEWEATFGNYTSEDPAVGALVRFLSHTGLEIAHQSDAVSALDAESAYAFYDYKFELVYEVYFGNIGLLLADPAAFVSLVRDFATNYPTDNTAVTAAIETTLRIMTDLEAILPILEANPFFPIDTTGLSAFVAEGKAFNAAYTEANGLSPGATYTGALLETAGLLADELALVAPAANAIAADVQALIALGGSRTLADFDLDAQISILTAFEGFFGTYGETNSDPLATTLHIVIGAGADTLGVVARVLGEADNAPYEDVAGTLEALLPNTPVALTLDDFGIPDQSDCISPRILVETDAGTLHIASTIYARDIGPVMLSFLPLQFAVVDGVDIGTPPAR